MSDISENHGARWEYNREFAGINMGSTLLKNIYEIESCSLIVYSEISININDRIDMIIPYHFT